MREQGDIEAAMDTHGSTVWRVCIGYFRADCDAQDAFQETFLKYATADDTAFEGEEHRKAWLIRVASNTCKDILKAYHRRNEPLESIGPEHTPVSRDATSQPGSFQSEVIDALRSLDDPPRLPLYLSLYEGYTAPEIADLLDAPVNTVYSWLSRGKKSLKEALS